MGPDTPPVCPSKAALIIGWILSILPALMLLLSAVFKFLPPMEGAEEGLRHIGWDASLVPYLGVVELAAALLYLFPRTAVLGAILLTGYMGGAIATHVRVGDPFFVQAIIGVVLWLGLFLREPRLRALIPIRTW